MIVVPISVLELCGFFDQREVCQLSQVVTGGELA